MAQFTLPKNSQIGEGKTWPAPDGATNIHVFRIYRRNPGSDTGQRAEDPCASSARR